MSFKQTDIEQLQTSFDEIINTEKEITCSSCKKNLTPLIGKEHLLKCQTCSKFVLSKTNNIDSSVVIQIGEF